MRLRKFAPVLAWALVTAGPSMSWSADPDDDDDRPTVKQLIGQLVNKNKRPRHEGAKAYPIWPKDYDWSEQKRIRDVWKELHDRAGEDLDELFNHLEDDRYCLTMAVSSGAYHSMNIGSICYHILRANIEPYQRPGDKRFEAFLPYPGDRNLDKKLREWWKSRVDNSLAELQLEAIDHARNTTTKRLDRNEDETEQERFREDLSHLDKLEEQIQETEEPIRVRAIAPEEFRFDKPKK